MRTWLLFSVDISVTLILSVEFRCFAFNGLKACLITLSVDNS